MARLDGRGDELLRPKVRFGLGPEVTTSSLRRDAVGEVSTSLLATSQQKRPTAIRAHYLRRCDTGLGSHFTAGRIDPVRDAKLFH